MAYEYSFMDNQVIGVDHLNKLAKRFVTSGIADPFANGVPYNVSKINDIVKANGTSGVVPNSVATLRVTKTNGNTVSINTGTAFFANGSTIDVTSPESLNFTPGVKNYIYLKSDMAQNKNYPACTTAQPTGDYVLLAEIDYAGTVTDKRVYAKGKLPGYQSDFNCTTKMSIIETLSAAPDTVHGVEITKNYVLNGNKYKYATVVARNKIEWDFGSVAFCDLDATIIAANCCTYGTYNLNALTNYILLGQQGLNEYTKQCRINSISVHNGNLQIVYLVDGPVGKITTFENLALDIYLAS